MEFEAVLDNKNHQAFSTGSIRDSAVGKGTPHLIAGEALYIVLSNFKESTLKLPINTLIANCHLELLAFTEVINNKRATSSGDRVASYFDDYYAPIRCAAGNAFAILVNLENGSISEGMIRLAQHYENGAKKYLPNNWRKGQPLSRYYDSAMRHLWKLMDGLTDEDHAAALLWNLLCIIQTRLDIANKYVPANLEDFPFTVSEVFDKKEK